MRKDVERLCKLYKDCIRIIKTTRIVEIVETVEKLYKTYENCENCGRGVADRPLDTPLLIPRHRYRKRKPGPKTG